MCACNCSQYLLLKLTSVLLYCFAGVTAWEDRGHTAIRLFVYQHIDTPSRRNLHRSIFAAAAARHATPEAAYSRGQMDE